MAQTYKFGRGTWATKEGSTLAYNDEGNNYKPLPFSFERDSIATRVNKEGLIEVVGKDIPRIDYTDSADGVLLLENSSTNLFEYSEDFSNSYWDKIGSSVTSGFISPDGTANAFKLVESTSNGTHKIQRSNFPINVLRTLTVFAKKGENERIFLSDSNKFARTVGVIFNLSSGILEYNQDASIYINPKIEKYPNDWYRCSVSFNNNTGLSVPSFGNASFETNEYQGDGASGIYIYGAQLEVGSYPTSYIPTNGSTVTRVAETCTGSGDAATFNDSEGVFMVEASKINDDGVNTNITISDSTNNNRILIGIGYQSKIGVNIIVGNSSQASYEEVSYPVDDFNKIAFSYKLNEFKLFVNGLNIYTDTSGLVFPSGTLNELNFGDGAGVGSKFYGNTKQIQYFDSALTDAELETLTSWQSFLEMANGQNYTII